METGEIIHVGTEGGQKVGVMDRSTVDGERFQDKFIILLEDGDTLEDGEHFACEFEPASMAAVKDPAPLSSMTNYLKLNKGNGY